MRACGASGNTIRVEVQRKVPETLYLEIAPGTVFLSHSGKVQNMTGGKVKGELSGSSSRYRPTEMMVLVDSRKRSYMVESFCLDYHKPAPKRGDGFRLALRDQRAMRILQPPEGLSVSVWAYQSALWMDRAGVSAEELQRRFRVPDVDIQVAVKLKEPRTIQRSEGKAVRVVDKRKPL